MGKRPIFWDTETTGIEFKQDRIIEIAAYDAEREKTFCSFINPLRPIPETATAIHNITDSMVKDAPLFEEVAKQFSDFCEGDAVLIAHNSDAFDRPFIEEEFERNDLSVPSWIHLDSLKWARKYRPDLPSHSLQRLREYLRIPANQAHRALDDVMILHQVFIELIDDLSMEVILELIEEKKKIRQMPFGKHKGKPLSEVPVGYIRWLDQSGAFEKEENRELKESFVALGQL